MYICKTILTIICLYSIIHFEFIVNYYGIAHFACGTARKEM